VFYDYKTLPLTRNVILQYLRNNGDQENIWSETEEGSGGERSLCNEELFNLHSSISTLNVENRTRLLGDFYVIRQENVPWKAVTKNKELNKKFWEN
jgi:hypothetical protein